MMIFSSLCKDLTSKCVCLPCQIVRSQYLANTSNMVALNLIMMDDAQNDSRMVNG